MVRSVSVTWLQSAGACEDAVELFRELFGEEVDLTSDNLAKAASKGLDLDWFASHYLPAQVLAEYKRVIAPGRSEYERGRAQAWGEYERGKAQAVAECERVIIQAWGEYERGKAETLMSLLLLAEDTCPSETGGEGSEVGKTLL